jgi:hypothetical protein
MIGGISIMAGLGYMTGPPIGTFLKLIIGFGPLITIFSIIMMIWALLIKIIYPESVDNI